MYLRQSFEDFLRNTVSLDDSRKDRVKRAHHSVREKLTSIDEVAARTTGKGTYLQGSYPLYTAVRPCDKDGVYDVDVVLAADFRNERGRMISGHRVLRWLRRCIESIGTYEGKTVRKNRCIRIDYESDNQRFHLDVVPAHRPDTLQGPIKIAPDWAKSDPKGYIDWFCDQCDDAARLPHVVRLLKYWRNLQDGEVNSMILTTIVAHHAPSEANSLDDALVKTTRSINGWMQDQNLGDIEVPNPSLPEEDLARNWSHFNKRRFRERLSSATEKAEEAIECDNEKTTIELWNESKLFDGHFPKTVRGLGEKAKEVAAAMGGGGVAVGQDGHVSPNTDGSGQNVPDNGGFFGRDNR
jgi:hypothetical protein